MEHKEEKIVERKSAKEEKKKSSKAEGKESDSSKETPKKGGFLSGLRKFLTGKDE